MTNIGSHFDTYTAMIVIMFSTFFGANPAHFLAE
jgi:hypothetical protein